MADRFDLEQALMDCWHTADDIETILTSIESDEPPPRSKLIFLLQGLKELHSLRSARAFEIFEEALFEKIFDEAESTKSDEPLPTHSPSVKQQWSPSNFDNKTSRDYSCYKNSLAQNHDYKN